MTKILPITLNVLALFSVIIGSVIDYALTSETICIVISLIIVTIIISKWKKKGLFANIGNLLCITLTISYCIIPIDVRTLVASSIVVVFESDIKLCDSISNIVISNSNIKKCFRIESTYLDTSYQVIADDKQISIRILQEDLTKLMDDPVSSINVRDKLGIWNNRFKLYGLPYKHILIQIPTI